MKRSCLVIALAFVAAFGSDSWGQSKQPSPRASQQNSAKQERGTDNSPVVVKVLPAEKPQNELDSEKAKEESDQQLVKLTGDLAKYTKLLFWATAVLAAITGVLVVFGFFQAKDSKRAIVAAESSAKIAERALTELEAPFISLKIVDPGFRDFESRDATVRFSFANHGRTPAKILEFLDRIEHVIIGETPTVFDPATERGKAMPYGVIAPSLGESESFPALVIRSEMTGPPAGRHRLEQRATYLVGYVKYADIFDTVFTVGFCLLFDPVRLRWAFRGDKKYNYHRKENGPYTPPADPPNVTEKA